MDHSLYPRRLILGRKSILSSVFFNRYQRIHSAVGCTGSGIFAAQIENLYRTKLNYQWPQNNKRLWATPPFLLAENGEEALRLWVGILSVSYNGDGHYEIPISFSTNGTASSDPNRERNVLPPCCQPDGCPLHVIRSVLDDSKSKLFFPNLAVFDRLLHECCKTN